MKRMVCLYIAILWVTMFILENCSFYCEKQMSFSFVVAVCDCRVFATSGESKGHPRSHFVPCFHGTALLSFLC